VIYKIIKIKQQAYTTAQVKKVLPKKNVNAGRGRREEKSNKNIFENPISFRKYNKL